MSLALSVKQILEATYDVPFSVNSGLDGKDPWITIIPANQEQSLFAIRLAFRNTVRLIITVEPQKYAANMVAAMGNAEETKRTMFSSFVKLIQRDSGKIDFSVNGQELPCNSYEQWPSCWKKLSVRISVFPLDIELDEDYSKHAIHWSNLATGLMLSLLDIVPIDEDDNPSVVGYKEGNAIKHESTRYERNPLNRQICLQHKGYTCAVCGFNFEERYGTLGKEFIHVHHITPVAQMGPGYVVKPLEDLVPVCPNCHSMLHRTTPPMSIEDLRSLITK